MAQGESLHKIIRNIPEVGKCACNIVWSGTEDFLVNMDIASIWSSELHFDNAGGIHRNG